MDNFNAIYKILKLLDKHKGDEEFDYELISALDRIASTQGIDCEALVQTGELPVFEKYDEYVPGELLRRAYAADRLRADEVIRRLHEMAEEY